MPKRGKAALIVIAALCLLAVLAPMILPYAPDRIDLDSLKNAPGLKHPFGTDQKGRDVMVRVLAGGRISLGVALVSAVIAMGAGLLVGLLSGYYGGRLDTALMAAVDLVLSFPSLLLAIGISILLPPGIYTVMIAIASVGWASFARLIRGYVLSLKESPFVDAARAVGCGNARIIFRHLMPQCLPLSLVMLGLKTGGYIITEASLSFLGLGAQPPVASWGSMISAGRSYILSAPWMVLAPGIAIAVAALSFNILGDALSERYGMKGGL
ncbi:MAG: ABC transporter permease [Thermodesulfovibrionales bacterium]|nr:ABC transporter permease [Thermodesulfovibrionales bacterium]